MVLITTLSTNDCQHNDTSIMGLITTPSKNDNQQNDGQLNDTMHNDTHNNDNQHNELIYNTQ